MSVDVHTGDALAVMAALPAASVDLALIDPPYGETKLKWDKPVLGWQDQVRRLLKPHGSLWVFGSLKSLLRCAGEFAEWTLAQDLVWEKHNGSNSASDRFRRVHEQVAHYYPVEARWEQIYHKPVFTHDAVAKTVTRRKSRPTQWGDLKASAYVSVDGGPRLMRSVLTCRSEHGRAYHPTQKPLGILVPLIEYSCPPDGMVLDCFAGVGSSGVAALMTKRNAILIEADPDFATLARERVAMYPLLPAHRIKVEGGGALMADPFNPMHEDGKRLAQFAAAIFVVGVAAGNVWLIAIAGAVALLAIVCLKGWV